MTRCTGRTVLPAAALSLLVALGSLAAASLAMGPRPLSPEAAPPGGAVIGLTVTPNPLSATLSAPAEVRVGQAFQVDSQVANRGPGDLHGAAVRLDVISGPPEGLRIADAARTLGSLGPGHARTVRWSVRALASGTYELQATATASDRENGRSYTAQSGPVTVTVRAP